VEVLPYVVAHLGRYYDQTAQYEFSRNIYSVFSGGDGACHWEEEFIGIMNKRRKRIL
jgi:hypothetical protein